MKMVIDEKLKHRLIGVAVIISLGAIFAPAMMKKSNQNVENNYSVRVKLPAKPTEPKVAISDEKEVFKTIKIAKVSIPDVSSESQLPKLAKAQALRSAALADAKASTMDIDSIESSVEPVKWAVNQAVKNTVKHAEVRLASSKPRAVKKPALIAKAVVKPKAKSVKIAAKSPSIRKPAVRSAVYAVQLASFSRLANAQALVNKLHGKGYKASFSKIASREGVVYKVYAGHSPQRTNVVKTKSQLASAMQLNGFIVTTGVS